MGRSARRTAKMLSITLADPVTEACSRQDACPLCQHDHAIIVAEKDRHGLPLRTQVCKNCGFVYSGNFISGSFATEYYATTSNAFKFDGRTKEETFALRTRPQAYAWGRQNWIKETLGESYAQIKTVIEAGCADGSNLLPYHAEGKKVFGADYDMDRLSSGRNAGMDLDAGDLESLASDGKMADLLILSHCVEHMSDVDLAFRQAAEIIGEQGYLYVEVPGIRGLIRPQSECEIVDGYGASNDLLGYLQVEHNFCFDLTTLSAFAERNGLRRIAGDEIVRAIFVVDANQPVKPSALESGSTVVNRLETIERDYLKRNPPLKRLARRVVHMVKSQLRG